MAIYDNPDYHRRLRQFASMKAIQIMAAMSSADEFMGIGEISRITGISPSTVCRVIQEMVECGFAVKEPEQRKYQIGFDARALAYQLKTGDYIYEAAKEEMGQLNQKSLETVHLIGQDHEQAVYLAKIETKNAIGLQSIVGKRIPMYCTSGGKCIMAWQPEEWLQHYLENHPLRLFTKYTITDEARLRRELAVIRTQGYALDNREHRVDVICIAAPVFDPSGKVLGSIGLAAPDYRFSLETALSYSDDIIASAQRITARLGGMVPAGGK